MKKYMIVPVIMLTFSISAFADHPDKMGLGVVIGGGYGGDGAGGDIGFALKHPAFPIFWNLFAGINSNGVGLRATGEYIMGDYDFVDEKNFNLDWHWGTGAYLNLGFGNVSRFAIGGRGIVGLSWHIAQDIELWLGAAPSFGLSIVPFAFPDWSVPVELGVRYWQK